MGVLSRIILYMNAAAGDVEFWYTGFAVLGFVAIFVFNFFYGEKFGIKKGKALLVTALSYVLVFLWAFLLAWVEELFTDWPHHHTVRVYIWMPLVLFIISKPLSIDWKTLCDFVAPSAGIVYGIGRLGCLFPGCCFGFTIGWGEWGVYSGVAKRIVFPSPLWEAVTVLALAGLAVYINKKKKYAADSKTYFTMLIFYGLNRFLWEFTVDNIKVFWGISAVALHAFLMSVVGGAMLVILHQREKQQLLKQKAPLK